MVYQVKDEADLEAKLTEAGETLVVIDFYATWCGPCKIIAPQLEKLNGDPAYKVVVLKVDVDECEELAEKYKISAMPTFVLIKNKETLESFSGANFDKLEALIKKYQ